MKGLTKKGNLATNGTPKGLWRAYGIWRGAQNTRNIKNCINLFLGLEISSLFLYNIQDCLAKSWQGSIGRPVPWKRVGLSPGGSVDLTDFWLFSRKIDDCHLLLRFAFREGGYLFVK